MAIDVSYRDTYTTSAEDLSRTNKNFIVNEGVAFDGMKVSQSGTPGMSVVVASGTGYFYGSGSNANVMYEFYSDATETVTIGASGVSARIDIICLKVDASTGVASIVAVAGTPSGSPTVPATPASHYKLAEVAVGAGVTTITNANITDTRRSVFIMPTGARNQGLLNGKIVPSVASNNLTVAIKTLTDTDPSATNPVGIWIGNTLRWITSALSITANGGTNYLGLGATELQTQTNNLFAYLQWNTTTNSLNLLLSKYCHAKKMSTFTNSNTNEKGAIGIVNYNSNNDVVLIDRFDAVLNASNNWTSAGNVYGQPILETDWLTFEGSIYGGSTRWTKGNGTTQCRYKITGNTITVTHLITLGSTSSIPATSTLHLDTPFGVASNFASVGAGWIQNSVDVNGAYTMSWRMGWGDASNRGILAYTGTRVTNIAPLVFGTDDQVGATITYQI